MTDDDEENYDDDERGLRSCNKIKIRVECDNWQTLTILSFTFFFRVITAYLYLVLSANQIQV